MWRMSTVPERSLRAAAVEAVAAEHVSGWRSWLPPWSWRRVRQRSPYRQSIERFRTGCTTTDRPESRARTCPPVSYTHLRAHETDSYLVCRLLLEKKKNQQH